LGAKDFTDCRALPLGAIIAKKPLILEDITLTAPGDFLFRKNLPKYTLYGNLLDEKTLTVINEQSEVVNLKRLIWVGIILMVVDGAFLGGCFLCQDNRCNSQTAAAIVAGARREVMNRTKYVNAYYEGGYPPDNEGVCADVIWRAFREAGYGLKTMVDQDIRDHLEAYPRVKNPDPNIDFRRVANLQVFLRRNARMLTQKIIRDDIANCQEWQGGDIVVFGASYNHIGVVSDRRRSDGVPYLIHNPGPYAVEEDSLLDWAQNNSVAGHYRWVRK
jgi:uncharacterized protein YijF (DUF1287 family)